jgi:hypothetical protein
VPAHERNAESSPVADAGAGALAGQTVVVVGGSAGMGLETARQVRAAGGDVVLAGATYDIDGGQQYVPG